jgi:hypothetical protein
VCGLARPKSSMLAHTEVKTLAGSWLIAIPIGACDMPGRKQGVSRLARLNASMLARPEAIDIKLAKSWTSLRLHLRQTVENRCA